MITDLLQRKPLRDKSPCAGMSKTVRARAKTANAECSKAVAHHGGQGAGRNWLDRRLGGQEHFAIAAPRPRFFQIAQNRLPDTGQQRILLTTPLLGPGHEDPILTP